MAAIIINVIPSIEQVISGIPRSIEITTSVPAMVFYTLDGQTPDTSCDIYLGELTLPANKSSVLLKLLATNGIDSSDVITHSYGPNISGARLPHSKATVMSPTFNPAPGSIGANQKVVYSQPYDHPVHQASKIPVYSDGYGSDPSMFPMREFDEEIPIFDFKYSETNSIGEMGKDIGTLPKRATIIYTPPAPETSNMNKKTYNPKSLVLYHDGTKPNENKNIYFRPQFSGEDLERDMYGTRRMATHANSSSGSGSFLKYYYNPTDNTITFYYRCNKTNRWIISKEPYSNAAASKTPNDYNLISPNVGDNHVYRWMLFKRSPI